MCEKGRVGANVATPKCLDAKYRPRILVELKERTELSKSREEKERDEEKRRAMRESCNRALHLGACS